LRAAVGLKARTGRAILVAIGDDAGQPRFLDRAQIALLPPGQFAPYHAAEELPTPAARDALVQRCLADSRRLSADGIRAAVRRLTAAGHAVAGCGILAGAGMPDWNTEQILAVHVRMHQAEGVMFREVLVAGARACKVDAVTLRDKAALDDAAGMIGVTRARLDASLAALGKMAGKPWDKDHKEAAAAALAALATQRRPARRPTAA
jgi:hypothetical protein